MRERPERCLLIVRTDSRTRVHLRPLKLDERAKEVEKVLKAAAEPKTVEFLVPLLPSQVKRMREVVENLEPSSLDEGFLSTVDAFMNKSHQDGMVRVM